MKYSKGNFTFLILGLLISLTAAALLLALLIKLEPKHWMSILGLVCSVAGIVLSGSALFLRINK